MIREAVESSNLCSVGYDAQEKVLEVEFRNGGVYRYGAVPPAVHRGLMAAESKGAFLAAHVRGVYHYAREKEPR